MFSSDNVTVAIEERKLFEIDKVLSVLCITLCENRHSSTYFGASLMYELLNSSEGLTRGDNVVYDEYFLAAHYLSVCTIEIKRLLLSRGDRANR